MADCVFCKIRDGGLPSEMVHDDGELFVIKDLNPAAPTHLLIIPHRHIETLNDLGAGDEELLGRVYLLASKLATDAGIAADGYRVVANCNRDGGQSVYHIHFHLLGGRSLAWPPG